MRIISKQLDIKLGLLRKKNSTRYFEKLKIEKQQGLMECHQEYAIRRHDSPTL